MARLELFPESYLALQQELPNHPQLCELLAKHPPQEFEIRLAEIATYCDVALDGEYLPSDIDKLCHILWKKLKEKSGLIVFPQ